MTVLAALAALTGGGLLVRSQYEREHFKTVVYTAHSSKIPKAFNGFGILFLTDLHNHSFGTDNDILLEAIDRLHPDIVAVGGDMMVAKGPRSLRVPLHLIKMLAEKYPVYYGLGNHESRLNQEREIYGNQYDIYMDSLEQMHVHILKDRSEWLERQGARIRLTGIDLPVGFYRKVGKSPMPPQALERILGDGHCPEYHILLAHSPLYFQEYARWGADLVLAGHFHGGTIRLPGLGGVMTPNYGFFPKYDQGFYQEYGSAMALSAGLGTHSVNIRLNNRPQLVMITLHHMGAK